MKHPNKEIQKNQERFLEQLNGSEREYYASIFRIGNAAYRYHAESTKTNEYLKEIYYREWLEGLPAHIKTHMEQQGFAKCKTMLPFTRYVNERENIGMDEWMKLHLSEEDYNFYNSNKS